MHQCLQGLAPSATDFYTNAKRDAYVTGSLRVSAANPLRELLALRLARRAAQRWIGVLVVLHDLNLAARFADRAVLLADGTVAATGHPEAVFRDALLTRTYGTRIRVERHETLGRLVVHT